MSDQRGSMTLWALGLSLLLFAVGFLSLDLWSAFSARSDAAAIADSAAVAGATALDEAAWRSGTLALTPALAEARAVSAGLSHPAWQPDMSITSSADPTGVTVAVTRTIPFRFVDAMVPDRAAIITVTGYAEPGEGP
jgi:Flp pilus assembly protein TadG